MSDRNTRDSSGVTASVDGVALCILGRVNETWVVGINGTGVASDLIWTATEGSFVLCRWASSFSFFVFLGIPGSEISTVAFYADQISMPFRITYLCLYCSGFLFDAQRSKACRNSTTWHTA